jgi:hypothetical protein
VGSRKNLNTSSSPSTKTEKGNKKKQRGDQEEILEKLKLKKWIYQLLISLWATTKQCGSPLTLREIPKVREVTSLCDRKTSTLTAGLQDRIGPAQGWNE